MAYYSKIKLYCTLRGDLIIGFHRRKQGIVVTYINVNFRFSVLYQLTGYQSSGTSEL